MRIAVAMLALAAPIRLNAGLNAGLLAGAVSVEIFENLPKGAEFDLGKASATDRYYEPAFGFVRTPTKFAANAVPLDRSMPFVLRARFERTLPAGKYRFRLRSRGAAQFAIDGKTVASTKAQKPNTSGDDPVPPAIDKSDSPLRPAMYPHQDAPLDVELNAGPHSFEMIAIIGGKGLMPTPGELLVSFGNGAELERLLGPDGTPPLTDAGWERYVGLRMSEHQRADVARRREVSQPVVAEWKKRHETVREYVKALPALPHRDVDAFLDERLKAEKIAKTGEIGDIEFLRRVTLDVTGLIPTTDEVRAYMRMPAAARRKQTIERLLQSPSWADHWVAYWQDVLAENPGILKPDLNNTGPFRWWLHQAFSDNVPFDRFVTELVEMQGSQALGGPAAFAQATLNDAPMAAKADIIGQAFLGLKLGCARCHDAPFHPYTQKDLFSLAAMLNGKDLKLPKTSTVPMIEGGRKPVVTVAIKPGESISPEWRFQKLIAHADSGSIPDSGALPSRREVAALIVAPDNTRFAEVVANRVWKRYMGTGIVEPADDWARAKPSHPELLAYLSREFMASGYDVKSLARIILNSKAYQRKPVAAVIEQSGPAGHLFAGPARRTMTSEQLVDSLHRATGKTLNCEDLNLNPAGDRPPSQFLDMGKPDRAWQLTALSNERDRPALALPIAQSLVDVMTAFGWRQSRQNAATTRDDAPSPMQTLILANGILGTRMVRLSDESYFTKLALENIPVEKLVTETFLRILSREPEANEMHTMRGLLAPVYAARRKLNEAATNTAMKTDSRVSWSNHLSAEATLIRMEEERRLRMGEEPTRRLTAEFRERYEDALWAVVNSPEFLMIP